MSPLALIVAESSSRRLPAASRQLSPPPEHAGNRALRGCSFGCAWRWVWSAGRERRPPFGPSPSLALNASPRRPRFCTPPRVCWAVQLLAVRPSGELLPGAADRGRDPWTLASPTHPSAIAMSIRTPLRPIRATASNHVGDRVLRRSVPNRQRRAATRLRMRLPSDGRQTRGPRDRVHDLRHPSDTTFAAAPAG